MLPFLRMCTKMAQNVANDHRSPKYPSLTGNGVAELNGGDAMSPSVLFLSMHGTDRSVYVALWAADSRKIKTKEILIYRTATIKAVQCRPTSFAYFLV